MCRLYVSDPAPLPGSLTWTLGRPVERVAVTVTAYALGVLCLAACGSALVIRLPEGFRVIHSPLTEGARRPAQETGGCAIHV